MCQHVYFSCFTVHHWNNCNPLSELTTQKFLFMFALKKNTPQRQQYTWVKKQQHYPLNETCIHAAYFTLESLCCFSSKNLYRKKKLWFNTPFLTSKLLSFIIFLKIHYFGKILPYQKVILILVFIIKDIGIFLD